MLNLKRQFSEYLGLTVTDPASPTSGQACRAGSVTGVAMNAKDATTNVTVVDIGMRNYNLSVKGVDGSGNSAVALYDALFYVDGDIFLSKKQAAGYFFGFAMATVGSGSTATIDVLHIPSPGAGTLSGTVGTGQLANSGVTAPKLSATLKTGFINLDLNTCRILATNAVQNTTEGGVPDGNTDPILARVNGATDIGLRLKWAAGSVVEVQFTPAVLPPDFDKTATMTVNLLLFKGSNTDTGAVVAVKIFAGVGDTNAGGNTAALATAALTKYSVTMAANHVASLPQFLNIAIVPGTHAADDVYLYAAWIEYTRA